MEVVFKIPDEWVESETLHEALRRELIEGAVATIRKEKYQEIEKELQDTIVKKAQRQLKLAVGKELKKVLSGTIDMKVGYTKMQDVTLEEAVRKIVEETKTDYRGDKLFIVDAVEKASTAVIEELKSRYDLLFASQLISKLNQGGYLKESAVAELLTQNDNQDGNANA